MVLGLRNKKTIEVLDIVAFRIARNRKEETS